MVMKLFLQLQLFHFPLTLHQLYLHLRFFLLQILHLPQCLFVLDLYVNEGLHFVNVEGFIGLHFGEGFGECGEFGEGVL